MSEPQGAADGGRTRVVVEVDDLVSDGARTVVSAAMQLFSSADPVDVVLCLTACEEPTQEQAEVVLGWCHAAVPTPLELPETLLVGQAEANRLTAAVRVSATGDVVSAARAVALLTAAAQSVWEAQHASPVATPADPPEQPEQLPGAPRARAGSDAGAPALLQRARALEAVARHDVRGAVACASGRRRPTVVGLFQHVSYWAAVEDVYRELAASDHVDFVPVALESGVDQRSGSTLDFLRDRGLDPREAHWLMQHLDDVDAVVLENPYDETRPPPLRVDALVRRGVRLVGLPYGGNAISGDFMTTMLWDMPLHRFAWRYYLPSTTQRELYARHCVTGDEPVRVLGNPKHDRIVRQAANDAVREPSPLATGWRELAAGRPVVVWNPHFRTAPGGWSTFPRYVRQLVAYAQDHDDVLLIVRPHFRLFSELRHGGLSQLERDLRAAAVAVPNLLLDESPDYRDALGVADALVSDLSSLASEFLVTGRPLLYLHRADGPGPSAEGGHLEIADRADAWPDVAAFLDRVRSRSDEGAPTARPRSLARSPSLTATAPSGSRRTSSPGCWTSCARRRTLPPRRRSPLPTRHPSHASQRLAPPSSPQLAPGDCRTPSCSRRSPDTRSAPAPSRWPRSCSGSATAPGDGGSSPQQEPPCRRAASPWSAVRRSTWRC